METELPLPKSFADTEDPNQLKSVSPEQLRQGTDIREVYGHFSDAVSYSEKMLSSSEKALAEWLNSVEEMQKKHPEKREQCERAHACLLEAREKSNGKWAQLEKGTAGFRYALCDGELFTVFIGSPQKIMRLNRDGFTNADAQLWHDVQDEYLVNRAAAMDGFPDAELHYNARLREREHATIIRRYVPRDDAEREAGKAYRENLGSMGLAALMAIYRALRTRRHELTTAERLQLNQTIEELRNRRYAEMFYDGKVVYCLVPKDVAAPQMAQRVIERGIMRFSDADGNGKKEWVIENRADGWTLPINRIPIEEIGNYE